MPNNQKLIYSDNLNSRRKFLERLGLGTLMIGVGGNSALASAKKKPPWDNDFLYDPFDFGAKGDSNTLDTPAIQAAIDSCHKAGGGKVYLHRGCFISGTLYLKSNVTLHIEAGTILRASNDLDNFPIMPSKYSSYTGTLVTNKMLIYAEDEKNITICGRGTIDGNGDHWIDGPYFMPSFSVRPRIIHFRGCENIHVRDVTLFNSASWVQSYQSCKNIVIDGITVDSRENPDVEKHQWSDAPGRNCDGLDITDCQQVRVSNCFITSGDDGIVLKSFSPDEACRNITITNCVISSNIAGIKIGTETAGIFEDIIVSNCTVYDNGAEAICLLTYDGARIERITISNISIRNVKRGVIGLQLMIRNRKYQKNAKSNVPCLKDVIIENLQGTRISPISGCTVAGINNNWIENVIFRNINLEFEGDAKASESYQSIPLDGEGNPTSARRFGNAYGFYITNAKNIYLDNINLRYLDEDQRPAVMINNVEQVDIKGLKAQVNMQTPEMIRLINTKDVIISQSRPFSLVPVFLSVYGDESDNIILQNNLLKNAKENVAFKEGVMINIIKESGTI